MRNPGIRVQLAGIANLVTDVIGGGGKVIVSAQLNRPRACGFFPAQDFVALNETNAEETEMALAKYQYYLGPLQLPIRPACGTGISDQHVCSRVRLPFNPPKEEKEMEAPIENDDDLKMYQRGKEVLRSLPTHKRFLADSYYNQADHHESTGDVCEPFFYSHPMQVMAPDGGAIMDSYLFHHINSMKPSDRERIFVALKGYSDPKSGWYSSLPIIAKDGEEVNERDKCICSWDVGSNYINPAHRNVWTEAINTDSKTWKGYFARGNTASAYPLNCLADDARKDFGVLIKDAARIFVVGYPLETAVLENVRNIKGNFPDAIVIVLSAYTWMLKPINEAKIAQYRDSLPKADKGVFASMFPLLSVEQVVRELQCAGANVNMPHPFLSGLQLRLWEPTLQQIYKQSIDLNQGPPALAQVSATGMGLALWGTQLPERVAQEKFNISHIPQNFVQNSDFNAAVLGVVAGDEVREKLQDVLFQLPDYSVCAQSAADVHQWIHKVSDESIKEFDRNNDAVLDVEELSDFIFDYFGTMMHTCWLRPTGQDICDLLPQS
eukprot:c5522_g1_i1.p1 GENE.c5522_g1_i1~~c5522_g1_i1.p1  ORF type:complete len:639 (-),score=89.63 c5522_g1_i1:24-1673(-)